MKIGCRLLTQESIRAAYRDGFSYGSYSIRRDTWRNISCNRIDDAVPKSLKYLSCQYPVL